MKKLFLSMVAVALALAWTATAAPIDGKWVFESKMAGKKGGEGITVKTTLNLKAEGNTLTGTVVMGGARRDITAQIKEGKIEGNKISFVTETQSRKGSQKLVWTATLSGDTLTGERMREGAKRGQPFTAKRAQ
jgi:hypothetical protein